MDGHGQPALLYLVPCTLGMMNLDHLMQLSSFSVFFLVNYESLQISGTCVVLGAVRGEVRKLWHYGADDDARESDSRGEA